MTTNDVAVETLREYALLRTSVVSALPLLDEALFSLRHDIPEVTDQHLDAVIAYLREALPSPNAVSAAESQPAMEAARERALNTDPRRALGMIEDYVRFAREALNDEHEGNFRYYVTQIHDLATTLDTLVKSW